jgi:hypothetical protein
MAITTVPPHPLFPPIAYVGGAAGGLVMNTTDDWLAWVFYWPGGDLTKCAFGCTAASGSPVVTAQLFNTDPTDGTTTPVNTGSAIGSAVDSAAMTANTIVEISGIGQSSLSAGIYALRLIFKSGTSCTVRSTYSASGLFATNQFPFYVTVTDGGSQTRSGTGVSFSVGGSEYIPIPGVLPACTTGSTIFASTSNPDEIVLWFVNPYPVSVRVSAIAFWCGAASRPDVRVSAYTGTLASPTQVFSQTFDRDVAYNPFAQSNTLPFSSSNRVEVAAGGTLGIGVRSATAHNLGIYHLDFANTGLMAAWWGANATHGTRENDAGAITQTTTRTPLIIPYIDGVGSSAGTKKRPGIYYNRALPGVLH